MNKLVAYGLQKNPFDIYSHAHSMANRKEEWERITKSLVHAFEDRSPRFFVILADYGEGKSYTLERIYNWLSESKESKGQVFAVYVKSDVLFQRPLAIMESEPKWQKFGLSLVTRIFDNIDRRKMVSILKNVNLEKLSSPFFKVFQGLKENEDIAFRYIVGDKMKSKELDGLGVRSPLSDSSQGIQLFFDFLKVIRLANYNNFLLLLDEFEYILSVLGEKKITQILNTFREIFDSFGYYTDRCPEGIAKPIYVFAISPGGWGRLEDLEGSARKKTGGGGIAPFMERVQKRDIIRLKPFTMENSKELVMLRLSEARTKKIGDPFHPFTEGAIEYVHSASFNKPRNVIQYCGILLEDALEENLERIDVSSAERILGRYGISKPTVPQK
jgi:hypothetical protein